MNFRQMQYVVMLSEMRNFSQVADRLGISQPALSKQISSLEKELGVRLFNRDTTPLSLTPAGSCYVETAKEMLYREERLLREMERFRSGEAGCLDIGVSPFRSQHLLPEIIKKLKKRYPGIAIRLHEPPSDQIRKETAEGKYDFAIVNLPVDEAVLDVIPIEKERLVLAVPNGMLDKLSEVPKGEMPQVNLKACAELPFVAAKQTQEMRQYFDKLFATAGIHPAVTVEVTGLTSAWAMVQAGIGAALLPLRFVDGENKHDGVRLFAIKSNLSTRQPVIITRRGQALTEHAQYAIELLTERG